MLPLSGKTIALAEGRQLEELAALLEKDGASTVRCPMLSILDAPDPAPVLEWLDELIADRFQLLILLTGEGVRRLVALAQRSERRDALVAALGRVPLLTRGPKPGQALKELGLRATQMAASPTTDGVIATLKANPPSGQVVGVQLYSANNPPLTDYLASINATVRTVQPYVYAPAADADRVAELIRKAATGTIDAIVFTSSPQIDRLYEVANDRGLVRDLEKAFARMKVASVGPIVSESLRLRGVRVDVQPEQGFQMKNLVVHVRRSFGAA